MPPAQRSAEETRIEKFNTEEVRRALASIGVPPRPPEKFLFKKGVSHGRGHGCFATEDIWRGTPLLAEKALFEVNKPTTAAKIAVQVNKLQQDKQAEFRELSGRSHADQNASDFEKFEVNQFSIGPLNSDSTKEAVFLRAARFNHSCVPNAYYAWNNTNKVLTINAISNVAKNEEIFISYVDRCDDLKPHHLSRTRRNLELHHWGFACGCPACQTGTEFTWMSEQRRTHMRTLQRRIDTNEQMHGKLYRLDGDIKALLELYEQEGIVYPEGAEAHRLIAERMSAASAQTGMHQTFPVHSLNEAVYHARQMLTLDVMCNGHSSPIFKRTLRFLRRLVESQV